MQGVVGATRVAARAVGIGVPMAAVGAAMHAAELRPRAVVAVGTCGAYAGSGIAIGQVVVARRVRLVDPSVLGGSAQYPEPMSLVSEADASIAAALARAAAAPMVDVATTLAITVDDAVAATIRERTGAAVEHLEAHGVATACAARGIPFAAVLGVANVVGARARAEWRVHHRPAARAAALAVLRWLSGGARDTRDPCGAGVTPSSSG